MVDDIFGGYYNRWSFGWPAIIRYLDRRYQNILGTQGILRFRDDFPRFFEAIQRYVQKPKWHWTVDGRRWWSPGLAFSPIHLLGFIDCSIYRTNCPFAGPDGDYEGAPRKRRWAVAQRAFLTGHRSRRGIKIQSVFMPNGISFIYGPVSARRHDASGGASVQDMSGLNHFLGCIQRGRANLTPPYVLLGDLIYGVNLAYIRTYYKAYFRHAQMTPAMRVCDAEFISCRQGIEWGYGRTQGLFKICKDPDNFKLASANPVSFLRRYLFLCSDIGLLTLVLQILFKYSIELLRVCHLMTNIYNCHMK